MIDRQTSLLAQEDQAAAKEASFLLQQLEVYNWGPFRGLHRAEFDPNGTAIIGPMGSGKTTLVDALMTLLVDKPRYNLASTGGHESDRTLISYVRGVLGGDGSGGREEVARSGKTKTAICATYRGAEQTLRVACLLWTEGTSNAADDLKRRWLFSLAEDQFLERWLRLLHDDGIRELTRLSKETANLRIFESKTAYLEHARKFFDVGKNAFTLLNRAAGLKQLNSIDDIFRDLVLEDRSAFDRALEVASEFDNLAAIHAELETARQQQESLVPVDEEYRKLLKSRKKAESLRTLKRIVPIWFAIVGREKWSEVIRQLAGGRDKSQTQLVQKQSEAKVFEAGVNTLRERYLKLGGNVIGELEKTISIQTAWVQEKSKHANEYRRMVQRFKLNDELSEKRVKYNQALLAAHRPKVEKQREEQEKKTLGVLSKELDQKTKLNDLELTLQKVKNRPGSNIPPAFQDFRTELAAQLSLRDADLPFLAELVEIRPEESAWRGAIERAIGADRLRILIPEDRLDAALRWVNHRDNRLHVRLQRAKPGIEPPQFWPDGYACKLNFKRNPLLNAAQHLLKGRDLHCVSSPEALKTTEHALTVQGMMSGKQGKFEKQDQRRLDQDWMTGFDNKDQLEALASQATAARHAVDQLSAESQNHRRALARIDDQLKVIDEILRLDFSVIDLPGAESALAQSRERLTALLNPKSDASQAKAVYDLEYQKLESHRKDVIDIENEIAVFNSKYTEAEQNRDIANEVIGKGLTEEQMALAKEKLTVSPDIPAQRLHIEEHAATDEIEQKLSHQLDSLKEIEQRLVRYMENARKVDTGALADTGSDIEDIPVYLERLRVLNEEALPQRRSKFLEYLNRSSDQGVTQLLAGIQEEVDAIEQRISELNQTLVKVDFRSNRYLQLQPQRIKDERLRTLDTVVRKVRSAVLKDDGGESHFKALQEMVGILREAGENRRQQGSRALLDPRFRLQFFVVEVDRQTGDRSPPRSGSQSGSGGEKELMASHILTASLSYALCPDQANRPIYCTVILDEAFSKSSASAASRIIEALRIFGLHPIFVTPNKEIGLLKRHTRKVICVQRPGKEASMVSISWEKLEELAHPQ
jgi:uncharacterized protein YPO0396